MFPKINLFKEYIFMIYGAKVYTFLRKGTVDAEMIMGWLSCNIFLYERDQQEKPAHRFL